jgi:hypothetical protein
MLNLPRVVIDIINGWYKQKGLSGDGAAADLLGLKRSTMQSVRTHGTPRAETLQTLVDGIAGGDVVAFFLRHDVIRQKRADLDRPDAPDPMDPMADQDLAEFVERRRVLNKLGLLDAYKELARTTYDALRKTSKIRLPKN